ncbi:hypothetical protein EV182_003373 [Spiromyces aspiralis]|uniref:Uncharacterized protein n=1 Tax=Spiromyces aspiralis TaxID=68401 RepID=A0ACC1HJB7_9FUNG|nr:hypothetical protein EV182_003373 [Spiromyces aspiralis]
MSSRLEAELLSMIGRDGEDPSERARAAENEAQSPTHSEGEEDSCSDARSSIIGEGMGSDNPTRLGPLRHSGPQTGPKGVLADKKHHDKLKAQANKQKVDAAKRAYSQLASRNIKSEERTIWSNDGDKNHKCHRRSSSQSSLDSMLAELENDESIDQAYRQYAEERIQELAIGPPERDSAVSTVSPEEYVNVVDSLAAMPTPVIVHLFNNDIPSSRTMDTALAKLSATYGQSRFLRVSASDCGFNNPNILPILLVYQQGDLIANLVAANSTFHDLNECTEIEVKQLLQQYHALL